MTRPSTQSIARACAQHPWRVLGTWIALIVLSFAAIALLLPGNLTTEGKPTNNPESWRALHAYEAAFPVDPRTTISDIAVVRSDRYTVESPQFKTFARSLFAQAAATGAVAGAHSWYDSHDPSLVSKDRHALIVPLLINDGGAADLLPVVERADRDPAFFIAVTGDETLDHDFNELSQHDLKTGELQFGLPAALIILLLVFGAIVAGLVPLLMAIVSIIVALGLTALVAQPVELSVFIVNMLIAMGLALGIDYSLFVVSRYREERGHRRDKNAAIATAGATASRAVLFSGSTFVVAMFGMLIVPSSVMRSLAIGAILVGIVSVLAALTLLPALLGLIGDRVNALRIPIIGTRSIEETNVEGRFWGGIVTRVQRNPCGQPRGRHSGARRRGRPRARNHHRGQLDLDAAGQLLVEASVPRTPARLPRRHDRSGADRRPGGPQPDRGVAAAPGSPTEARRGSALRRRLDPPLLERRRGRPRGAGPGRSGGRARGRRRAEPARQRRAGRVRRCGCGSARRGHELRKASTTSTGTSDPAPYVFVFVLGLTFVLLTIAFRSIVVAATSVALNLLSVARGIRTAGARLPARCRCRAVRLSAGRRHRGLGAALPLLRALRTLDGLPGVPAQPHPRALRHTRRHARSRVRGASRLPHG